jgi:hypothetical protein
LGLARRRVLFPGETIHRHDELLGRRDEFEVADLHHRVLHMRGDDFQIFFVKGEKLEQIHGKAGSSVGFRPSYAVFAGRATVGALLFSLTGRTTTGSAPHGPPRGRLSGAPTRSPGDFAWNSFPAGPVY